MQGARTVGVAALALLGTQLLLIKCTMIMFRLQRAPIRPTNLYITLRFHAAGLQHANFKMSDVTEFVSQSRR